MEHLILASQSPRRKQLLEQAELSFVIRTAHSDENFPADMEPEQAPLFIASNKAEAVFETLNEAEQQNAIIIAADTVVILEGKIIGKPTDADDAKNILRQLSGKVHKVVTGVVIFSKNKKEEISETTEVHFLPLQEMQIDHYVEKYKPLDKAGAYAIQEWIGLTGIKKIDGDFYNVMGLPVSQVLNKLSNWHNS
ncbi:MAG: Maf family protein [Taibaiella sp.]|jgi:septum formation protein